jgi:hypothetical protein
MFQIIDRKKDTSLSAFVVFPNELENVIALALPRMRGDRY